jgi:2,3-bisphosphoglycerate-dependent phosphoglycerate mutase
MNQGQQGKLVIIRHGESTWNLENRFTGWVDVDLTAKGLEQAYNAGLLLKNNNFVFDIAYTSVLKRAIKTLWNILDAMNLMWIPTVNAWELNERHYGGLTGLDKSETAIKHGEEQLKIWRRSYDIRPPVLTEDSEYHAKHDRKYQHLDSSIVPDTECLKDTLERVLPYWENIIYPQIKAGKNVLIAAHGNSLRALIKHLGKMTESEILELNLANGEPMIYDFNGYDGSSALNYSILK